MSGVRLAPLGAAGARLAATAEGLSDVCWSWRLRPGRWTPAEVVEHVVLVCALGAKRLRTLSPKTEAPAITDGDIPYLFYQGDEPTGLADPTGQYPDKVSALQALEVSVSELAAAVDLSLDLRAYGGRHPLFGMLDGEQWISFYAAHMDRHRAELIGIARAYREAANTA